jgi:predicted RNase H-like HicB family nuclease
MIGQIQFTGLLFQRNGYVLSYCPELNVGSFGDTPEEARASLVEAVQCFLEGCEELGTLEEVLEEARGKEVSCDAQDEEGRAVSAR